MVGYPCGGLILRDLKNPTRIVTKGKGAFLYDDAGKDYLDFSCGAFVNSVGHAHPEIARQLSKQLETLTYANGMQFISEPCLKLAEKLHDKGKAIGLTESTFLCSGSEAIEAALKLAYQIQFHRGHEKRTQVIARNPSYHGNTLYALGASGRPRYRAMFNPLLEEVHFVKPPYPYRGWTEEDCLEELRAKIQSVGAENIYAFILEPIGGASVAGTVPSSEYFQGVMKICQENGILTIADEVACGAGRTGKFFCSEHFGFGPDILALGKGISGGFAPLSVLMTRRDYIQDLGEKTGQFVHQQTFMLNPYNAAAGLAVVDLMDKENLVERTAQLESEFLSGAKKTVEGFPFFGNVSGKGLLAAIEVVADPATRKPFDRSKKVAESIRDLAFENGLVVWPAMGQVNGTDGDVICIAPPLNITSDELALGFERLHSTFKAFATKS